MTVTVHILTAYVKLYSHFISIVISPVPVNIHAGDITSFCCIWLIVPSVDFER